METSRSPKSEIITHDAKWLAQCVNHFAQYMPWRNEAKPHSRSTHSTSAYSLAFFRILFGLLVAIGMVRFWANGWIEQLYLEPSFHFTYFGFRWVQPLGIYTYTLFILCTLSAIGVALGWRYRWSATLLFLSFTYIELMDKTTYLNHYYFVSVIALILCFLPAHAVVSLDAKRHHWSTTPNLPDWPLNALRLLVAVVYFYAGLAKLNSDWLLEAEPLRTWLAAKAHLPLIGFWLKTEAAAYTFSWGGAIFDLTVPFLLWADRTRPLAFVAVVGFHVMTRILFPIGMFPFFMIAGAALFFPSTVHQRILQRLRPKPQTKIALASSPRTSRTTHIVVIIILALQLLLPWRYLAFPNELFWTEQGYRFSWRVMLMEKAGYAQFKVIDPTSGKRFYVDNSKFLTPFQEKQMAFQPDFLVEYAHFLAEHYQQQGITQPQIYVDCHVALNGRPSQRFVRPEVDLAQRSTNPYTPRDWLLPFNDIIYGL